MYDISCNTLISSFRIPLAMETLADLEHFAVEMARLAGRDIETSFGRALDIRYKQETPSSSSFRQPVSELDLRIETMIRSRLAERFPHHNVVGEELGDRLVRDARTVWLIDPIDGTDNFVNGFPLFSASVGVLHDGRPVAGALWCSTGHLLRPGVYHAREGGTVMFEGYRLPVVQAAGIRRRVGADPKLSSGDLPWAVRKTGSTALECAFVATGLLQVARFPNRNAWDVAGGLVLVKAAGLDVLQKSGGVWSPLTQLALREGGSLAHHDIIIGETTAVAHLREVLDSRGDN